MCAIYTPEDGAWLLRLARKRVARACVREMRSDDWLGQQPHGERHLLPPPPRRRTA